jgi:hypothetical protein
LYREGIKKYFFGCLWKMRTKKIEPCKLLDVCPFHEKYKDAFQDRFKGWVKGFCSNKVRSETCARNIFCRKNDLMPPVNLTPCGEYVVARSKDEN